MLGLEGEELVEVKVEVEEGAIGGGIWKVKVVLESGKEGGQGRKLGWI